MDTSSLARSIYKCLFSPRHHLKAFEVREQGSCVPVDFIPGDAAHQSQDSFGYMPITLQNVGTGVAFNVMSVIFGPESVEDNGKNLDASKNDYWHCKINILNIGENKPCKYSKPLQNLLKGNVDGYSFLAPPQPLIDPSDKKRMLYEDWFVCRVTTTYRDIFKRKHASIFDLDIRGYWIMRAFLEDIPKDLFDLQRDDQPFRVQPLARYLGNRLDTLLTYVIHISWTKIVDAA